MKKRRILALALSVVLVFGMTACSGNTKEASEQEGQQEEQQEEQKEEVKLITEGRLSAMEAPEGWEMQEPNSDNELIYEYSAFEGESDYRPQLWIDIDDWQTPEECIENAKENNAEAAEALGKEIEVEDVTIGDVDFKCLIPLYGSYTLYGTKDDVTILVSYDPEIELEDETVQAIINSIQVAPASEE